LTETQINDMVWKLISSIDKDMDIHHVTAKCVEHVLEQSMR